MTRALPFAALDRLAAEHELDVWEGDSRRGRRRCASAPRAADGLLSLVTDPVDAELLAACPDLKAIANMAVGTDNIDLEAAAARGIPVGNTPDVLTDATADLAFALLLARRAAARRGRGAGARRRAGAPGSRPAISAPTSPARRSGSSGAAASATRSPAAPTASGWR